MKLRAVPIILTLVVCLPATVGYASLIGDSVNGTVTGNGVTGDFSSNTATVGLADQEFRGTLLMGEALEMDITIDVFADFTGNTLTVGFENPLFGEQAANFGSTNRQFDFTFTDLNWLPVGNRIIGAFLIESSGVGDQDSFGDVWTEDPGTQWNVSFTGHSITVGDIEGYSMAPEGRVSASYEIMVIPEPATIALLVLGLFGIVLRGTWRSF